LPALAERSLPMDWAYVGARSNGNADALIGHLVKLAKVRGHNSAFLFQLGVPMSAQGMETRQGEDANAASGKA
jgi:hypothetical protein